MVNVEVRAAELIRDLRLGADVLAREYLREVPAVMRAGADLIEQLMADRPVK